MTNCYFCEESPRVSYFSYYCCDCAMLRRMLLINGPKKCIDILKRTLTRDSTQIDFKINQEIKKLVLKEIEELPKKEEKESYASKTRSKANLTK